MSQLATRARVACKLCNSRRVRCDRSATGITCSNCEQANTPCELIVSRRGKYKRFNQQPPNNVPARPSPTVALQNRSPLNDQTLGVVRNHGRDVSPSLSEIAVHRDPSSSDERVLYIGDSANYRYVLHEVGDPFRGSEHDKGWIDNLQHYMMDQLGPVSQDALRAHRAQDQQRLRDQRAFWHPEKTISDELIRVFFDYSYPACPIFHQADFMNSYREEKLSPLVLNAVFFMAVLHCSESLLMSMGFANRYLASLTFYRRSKALYDAEYESDGIATVQSLILLSHRCDGPLEQKDTWHWLGVASGLAQSLGMHRRKSYSILAPRCQVLWRRIWWVLYINDVHYAAIYGRPPHINPSFCDIRPLLEEDFQEDDRPHSSSEDGTLSYESKLYIVHFAELASRASRCIDAKYSGAADLVAKRKSYEEILNFQATLTPRYSALPAHITLDHGFWPSLIHLYQLEYQIVFYRGLSDGSDSSVLVELAGRITRILEDLLASGTLYRAPFHLLPAIFASTVVHIIQARNEESHTGILSRHRVSLTLHILDGFKDSWPHVIYTRYLLDCLLKNATSTHGYREDEERTFPSPSAQHSGPTKPPATQQQRSNTEAFEEANTPHFQPFHNMVEDEPIGLSTPVMPMFSFNNPVSDIGLGPEFWALD